MGSEISWKKDPESHWRALSKGNPGFSSKNSHTSFVSKVERNMTPGWPCIYRKVEEDTLDFSTCNPLRIPLFYKSFLRVTQRVPSLSDSNKWFSVLSRNEVNVELFSTLVHLTTWLSEIFEPIWGDRGWKKTSIKESCVPPFFDTRHQVSLVLPVHLRCRSLRPSTQGSWVTWFSPTLHSMVPDSHRHPPT